MANTSVVMEEEWQEIPGHEGYEVSDHGRVRSYWRSRKGGGRYRQDTPHLLTLVPDGSASRWKVHLGGQAQNKAVHTLVLLTFVGPPQPGQECRHLNGNKLDNRLSNLAWGTKQENAQDGVQHGTWAGERNGRAKVTEETVRQIRAMASSGTSYREIGRRMNLPDLLVGRIVRRVTWAHVQ